MTLCHDVTKPDLPISACRCARKLILFLFPWFFVIILLTLNLKVTCEGHKNSRKCSVTFYWKVTCEGHVAIIILFEFLYMENI